MEENPLKLGYSDWGHGSINQRDWIFLKENIKKHQVKSFIEIGLGLSTLLITQLPLDYRGYDTLKPHLERLKKKTGKDLRYWTGKTPLDLDRDFDMAFIDGPASERRYPSIKSVVNNVNLMAIHDCGDYLYSKWSDLAQDWKKIAGGTRMSLWQKTAS